MLHNTSSNKKQNKIDFIDRSYYRSLIDNSYKAIVKNPTDFKIIFLYGPGGFGKTSLLENCLKKMDDPKARPIHISLEITNKDDKLDILIKFRKALPKKHFYPLFDYAMQFLWNSLNTSQLDNEFLSFTKNSLWQFVKSGTDVAVTAVTSILPVGIATASLVDLLDEVYNKLKNLYGKHNIEHILDNIEYMQSHDLIDLLPQLLGMDIYRCFLKQTLVFVIDAYQQYSKQLICQSDWLVTLVQNIGYGLFVITSRENICWPDPIKQYVVPKSLSELPEKEVYQDLIKKFEHHPQLVDNIITVTGCIPIYLDLAVKSLDNNILAKHLSNNFYFKNKEDIVRKFLIHLSEDEQETIRTLAIVQIFNQEIFEFLVKDLHLPVSVLSFDYICNRSLIRNVEYDSYFYKTHQVISNNIGKITSPTSIQRIFKSYITIIGNRLIYSCTNFQVNMLFKHIIFLVINYDLSLSEEDVEKLLDIYFVVKESLLPFSCDEIQGFDLHESLRNIYFFLKALSEERKDSHVRLIWLNQICETSCKFGKHVKSFQLMKGYLKALCESSQYLKRIVDEINPTLSDIEKQEWYYGQTKIFLGDCNVSYGKFKTGINELQSYKLLLPKLIGKENDAFQVTRHIAHGYRFNMLLEEAETLYRSLIEGDDIIPTPLQKIYILTNLCETFCYFKPDELFKIENIAFTLADKLCDLKSKGKISYSRAIAYLHTKKYKLVEQNISDSISFNKDDGYRAGQLYAYMAQAYYEYARYGSVSKQTLDLITDIHYEIKVYGYFSLPLALMEKKYSQLNQIREEYEWLDFDKTVSIYMNFLDSIRGSIL